MSHERPHFFISYTSADKHRADWIAQVLDNAGYTFVIQSRHFPPGSNFVVGMQEALQSCDQVLAVLSPNYLKSGYAQAEWSAAFAADPKGAGRKLVPVMVEHCVPAGLLGQVVHIAIHGLDESAAALELLKGIEESRAGVTGHSSASALTRLAEGPGAVTPPEGAVVWDLLSSPPDIVWRSTLENCLPNQFGGFAAVELHLVPVSSKFRLQVRDLKRLESDLPTYGRQHGIFGKIDGLNARSSATAVVVTSAARDAVAGLGVTRLGQRSAWVALPRDMLGAVLDEDDITRQLARMLKTLIELPLPDAQSIVPAVGVDPADIVSIGHVGALPRNSAQLGHRTNRHIRPAADDAVTSAALRANTGDIGAELAARLVAEYKSATGIG